MLSKVILSMAPTELAVDRVLAPTSGAAGAASSPPSSRTDLVQPVARVFASNLTNPQLNAADRTHLVQLVMQQTGLPQADTEKRVDQAFTDLKAAEQKVRDAAEQARKATLIAAFLAAATLARGLISDGHRNSRLPVCARGARSNPLHQWAGSSANELRRASSRKMPEGAVWLQDKYNDYRIHSRIDGDKIPRFTRTGLNGSIDISAQAKPCGRRS
jgi:hypothetical protein